MGRLKVLSESYLMNANITGLRWFSNKYLRSCASALEGLNFTTRLTTLTWEA